MIDSALFTLTSSYASDPSKSRGRLYQEEKSFNRDSFQRDRDRIVHSGAFRKLQYKTQVFLYHEGDYFRTRLTHSLEVAQIARSLARAFGGNQDLVEAISLSHDLGHTCFGHAGEDALNEAMLKLGGFDHNEQSFRVVTWLERKYPEFKGLNLSWETLEGIVKHNGPVGTVSKSLAAFNKRMDLEPQTYASLEAQIAAISDDIAYNNHDMEDGIRSGLLTLDQLRALPLIGEIIEELEEKYGTSLPDNQMAYQIKRALICRMIKDVLSASAQRLKLLYEKGVFDIREAGEQIIAFSPEYKLYDHNIRTLLMDSLYRDYKVCRMSSWAKRCVKALFECFWSEPACLPNQWRDAVAAESNDIKKARIIGDYIAGMTDRYAQSEYNKLFGDPEFLSL